MPSGTTDGDLLVVGIATSNVSGPAAPTGWTRYGPYSSGTGHSVSVYTAPYSASLTLSFTNVASLGAWACNAFYQASSTLSLDGSPVAAHNTTSNTTLPTGAPTTGATAGDYEVLVYGWNSSATISTVASGSTIDATRANGAAPSVAIGHNNTNPLGASVTVTAFSQTLSAAQTRKTGVGVLLIATAGGASVDLNGSAQAQATASASLRVLRALTGTVTARATVSLSLAAQRMLSGSSAGQATASLSLARPPRDLSGSSAGRATTSGTLSMAAVTRQLVGTATARATARLTLGKLRLLVGRSNGVADAPRTRIKLTKPRLLTSSSAGRATVALSVLGARKTLAGGTAGGATASASLSAIRVLAGRTDGLATVTAFVFRPPRLDVFLGIATSSGEATVSLVWGQRRDLVGVADGGSSASVLGFGQARAMAGVASGAGTASGWLALAPVVGPIVPAEVFDLVRPRQLIFQSVPSPDLVHSAARRQPTFVARR